MVFNPADIYRVGEGDVDVGGTVYILLEKKAETCYLAVERDGTSPAPVVFLDIGATPNWVAE